MEQRRILLAVTGGIAAYKAPELVRVLRKEGHAVRCMATPAAVHFVSPLVLQSLCGSPVRTDPFDAAEEGAIGHIELADWAELLIVAPATANIMARLAHGLAEDLVSTVALATRAPILLAPAMNVNMWRNPATQDNWSVLQKRGVRFIGPDAGELACGWEGEGRMAAPAAVADAAALVLGSQRLSGQGVLVTAGGTREPVDDVRYLGNRSSGKMGYAIAGEAARRGAEVVLVSGPSDLETPAGVRRVDVETALEMREAVFAELPGANIVIKSAAVADFRAAERRDGKIRKQDLPTEAGMRLDLVRNPDILSEICQAKGDRVVVGFAAESGDLLAKAREKLARKGCDLLVANDVAGEKVFGSDHNTVVFVWPGGDVEELPPLPKTQVAARLLDCVEKLCGSA